MKRKLIEGWNKSIKMPFPPAIAEYLGVTAGNHIEITQEVTKKGERFVKLTPAKEKSEEG